MIAPTIGQVDEAVRAVLAGFRQGPVSDRRSSVTFSGKLLGQRQLEQFRPDLREIRVTSETVITPIARDMLKRRGIVLRLVSELEAARRGTWGFGLDPDLSTPEAIRRALFSANRGWNEIEGNVIDVARWVASDPDRGAVMFAVEGSVACWMASRAPGVRSAAPADADGVARAVNSLGINLLVIEPAGHSIPSLLNCVKVFRNSGAPQVPEWLGGRVSHEDWRGDRPFDLLTAAPECADPAIPHRRADDARGNHRGFSEARGGTGRVR